MDAPLWISLANFGASCPITSDRKTPIVKVSQKVKREGGVGPKVTKGDGGMEEALAKSD